MPVRQKSFRIEKMTPGGEPRNVAPNGMLPTVASPALQHHDILNELKMLRALIEQRTAAPGEIEPKADQITLDDLNTLKNETGSIHRAIRRTMQELASLHFGAFGDAGHGRASRELDAVVDSTERATQQILEAAESIDEAANTLSASLKHEQEQALTSDIRDHVVRIFEACNFQDLTGQRIAKVLATLTFVEHRVARMLEIWGGRETVDSYAAATPAEPGVEPPLVSGPKLNGDRGHVSQQEIDAMFA
ncbi:MAG TPA: protein phosphatase CheZ [Xanthobacteraceae bacterium]|jgi:chemotaxis protein CheZ